MWSNANKWKQKLYFLQFSQMLSSFLLDCGLPEIMNHAIVSLDPELPADADNDTKVSADTVATYTCTVGNEYSDESTEKTTVCSLGGVWLPELIGVEECRRKFR